MARRYILFFFYLVLLLSFREWWYWSHIRVYRAGEKVSFEAEVRGEPEVISGRQRFSVVSSDGLVVQVTTSVNQIYDYGQKLDLTGRLEAKRYQGKTFFSLFYPGIKVSERGSLLSIWAGWLRDKAVRLYEQTLPDQESSLLLGVVLGGNWGMGKEFLSSLRSVGVIHVISASGMNVTFAAGALIALLGSFLPRRVTLVFGMVGVLFYGFMAGFSASVLRACLMAWLAFGAGMLGRQYLSIMSLFLTFFVLLFYSPMLIVNVGFWLSFLSTAGILVIQPMLGWGKKWYLTDLSTTLSAQIATLPVMLGVFGQYGMLSLLVNVLVLWMIPFLMALGSAAILFGLIIPILGKVLLYLCLPFLWFFVRIVVGFASAGLVWKMPDLPWEMVAGYYLLVIGWLAGRKQFKRAGENDKELHKGEV